MTHASSARTRGIWTAIAVALVTLGVLAVVLTTGNDGASDEVTTTPAAGAGCNADDVEYIDLDTQISEPASPVCFLVEEPTALTVGAAAVEADAPISLTVATASGDVVATADSTPSTDPEVSLEADAGVYEIIVTPQGDTGAAAPPYLLVTSTLATPASAAPTPRASSSSTPATATACPAGVPTVATDAPATVDNASPAVCLELTEDAFVKMGADSHGGEADLRLSVMTAGDESAPVIANDDTFGTDPEVSWDMVAGAYLLEVSAWDDAPFSDVEVYVDATGTLMRQGEPAAAQASLDPTVCDSVPAVTVGDALTVEGEGEYVCVSVDTTERLTIQAATLGAQDLVLEVLGFTADGDPYRAAWADGNPRATSIADTDPLLDQVIPEGTWVVAVTDYLGAPGADYDIRVVATDA